MTPEQERELLELAAQACGFIFNPTMWGVGLWGCFDNRESQRTYYWNPLTSPGDCAEMEDKLELDISRTPRGVESGSETNRIYKFELYADHNNDRGAARRMASVRVAAEIGRRMEK